MKKHIHKWKFFIDREENIELAKCVCGSERVLNKSDIKRLYKSEFKAEQKLTTPKKEE